MTTSDPAAVVLPRHCTTTSPRPTLSGLLAHATLYYYIFLPNTTPPYTGLLHAQTGGSAEGPPRAAPRAQPAPLNSTRHHPSAVSIRPVIFHQASVICIRYVQLSASFQQLSVVWTAIGCVPPRSQEFPVSDAQKDLVHEFLRHFRVVDHLRTLRAKVQCVGNISKKSLVNRGKSARKV
jgi:hypothetical protein